MAKFNLELEIDWIDEESNLDEAVKQEILNAIENRVTSKIQAAMLERAEKNIESKAEEIVTNAILEKIDEFINKPRNITDRYGDVIRENITVETLIKEKIDSAFDKKTLDDSGKKASYSPKFSIFEFCVGQGVETLVEKKVSELAAQTKIKIEELVTEKIKTQVADNLTDLIMENSTALKLKGKNKKGDDLPI